MTGKLFRFELAFNGEPQGIGFLEGLVVCVDLWRPIRIDLYSQFDTLPAYEIDEPDGVSFWFTEEGLSRYDDAINRVADELAAEGGWRLIGAAIDNPPDEILYQNAFQVAFPLECIRMMDIKYVPVTDVDEFLKQTS